GGVGTPPPYSTHHYPGTHRRRPLRQDRLRRSNHLRWLRWSALQWRRQGHRHQLRHAARVRRVKSSGTHWVWEDVAEALRTLHLLEVSFRTCSPRCWERGGIYSAAARPVHLLFLPQGPPGTDPRCP